MSIQKIYCYNTKGKYLNSFTSVEEAARTTKKFKHNVERCLRGERSKAGKYIFSYKELDTLETGRVKRTELINPIHQYSPKGKLLGKYKTLEEAERKTGVYRSVITRTLNGYTKIAGGFIWTQKKN